MAPEVDWRKAYFRVFVQQIEQDSDWLERVVSPVVRDAIAEHVHVASESAAAYEAVMAQLWSLGIPRILPPVDPAGPQLPVESE